MQPIHKVNFFLDWQREGTILSSKSTDTGEQAYIILSSLSFTYVYGKNGTFRVRLHKMLCHRSDKLCCIAHCYGNVASASTNHDADVAAQ